MRDTSSFGVPSSSPRDTPALQTIRPDVTIIGSPCLEAAPSRSRLRNLLILQSRARQCRGWRSGAEVPAGCEERAAMVESGSRLPAPDVVGIRRLRASDDRSLSDNGFISFQKNKVLFASMGLGYRLRSSGVPRGSPRAIRRQEAYGIGPKTGPRDRNGSCLAEFSCRFLNTTASNADGSSSSSNGPPIPRPFARSAERRGWSVLCRFAPSVRRQAAPRI
jgi:hypothetical protein